MVRTNKIPADMMAQMPNLKIVSKHGVGCDNIDVTYARANNIAVAIAVDDIAERIRSLDVAAPATYKAFSELSSIKEVDGVPSAEDMTTLLTKGHEQVVKTCRAALAVATVALSS